MNVTWTPLTEDELAGLKEGDSVVILAGSKDGAQWHPIQRTRPGFFYIRDAKFAERSTRGRAYWFCTKILIRSGLLPRRSEGFNSYEHCAPLALQTQKAQML
jgi:hypothetical protein